MAERPFVDTPPDDVDQAGRVAAVAAARLGLPQPELRRVGMNAIFDAGEAVLRVGRTNAPAHLAHDLARVLEGHGVRVPRPLGDVTVELDGFSVTAWERLVPDGSPVQWRDVGRMVAAVHALPAERLPAGLPSPSPAAFPWWDFDAMLSSVRDLLDDGARRGLEDAVHRHSSWRVDVVAHRVVCHGDVHPGNVIQTAAGPVLLDWDLLCRAPWGWDHAPMMTLAARWGGEAGGYEAFADGYGRDGRHDEFAVAVAELRLVAATLMRLRAGRSDPAAAAEAERRLRYWRGDPDAPAWRAQ